MKSFFEDYDSIREGGLGFRNLKRGLVEVSGAEAIKFLNGLITNDLAKLEDEAQMLAAFPTVKGRIFALVRVVRFGDKFLLETEEATKQKVFENLFRFTFAGDFVVDDLSDQYEFYRFFGDSTCLGSLPDGAVSFQNDIFIPIDAAKDFHKSLSRSVEISDELYEVLRIEAGIPKYGVDMGEKTVVPEIGIDEMISYKKGCYIGQEVIARIHFMGKAAKKFMGLVFVEEETQAKSGDELISSDGKNAGAITSVVFSPKLGKTVALGFVRNAFLDSGTELKVGEDLVKVSKLPFAEGETDYS